MIHLSAKSIYVPIAALVLLAGSCTNDNEPMATDPNAIAFQTSVQTRAVTESFGQGDAFTVWGGYDNDATNVFDGETVTYNGANWSYSGGTRYWVSGKTYDFYAVYPTGVGSCSANGTITVVDFDTSSNTDLMTAEASMEGSEPQTVSFAFRHELARVQVVAQCDPGVTATLNSASLNDVSTQGTLTRTSTGATWKTPSSSTLTGNSGSQIVGTYNLFGGDLLLIPQTPATLSVNITRSSETSINETFNLADYTNGQWVAGEIYRYTILIKQDNITITFSNFTADEWGETHTGGDINIGESTN